MPNNKYSCEFKKEAVKTALEPDANRKEIADNLGIKYKTLCTWIHLSMTKEQGNSKSTDYKSRYQELVAENAELKRKLKKTETEREILKKAAAYFANPNT